MQSTNTVKPVTNHLTILLCVLAAFCEGIDLQAAGVAAAGIVPEFKASPQLLGSFFSASTLGLFFGALIGGRLSDRVGRKWVLVTSIAVFGLFSLCTALAWDMTTLIWARLLTGVGLGGALPNLIALVSESSADNRRSANVALVYSGTPLGGALVSLISLLIATDHWRWIFVIGGVLPLIIAPIMAIYLQESAAFKRTSAIEVATLSTGKSFAALLTDGRASRTLLLWLSFFLGLLTLYLLLNWLPTLLGSYGLNKSEAAFAQIGFNVGGALAALLIGRLLEGPLRRPSVVITFVSLPMLLIWLARAPSQLILITTIVFVLGSAVVATQAFLYATAPICYPTVIRGVGVGSAVALGRIGSIVGPTLAGILVAGGHTTAQLLIDILPVAVLGGLCAIALLWLTPLVIPVSRKLT